MKIKRIVILALVVMAVVAMFAFPVFADGDVASAVERFTLLCGCGLCSVILADNENQKIIRQFFKDETNGQVVIN